LDAFASGEEVKKNLSRKSLAVNKIIGATQLAKADGRNESILYLSSFNEKPEWEQTVTFVIALTLCAQESRLA
jgi:hypothetical protein